MLKRLTSGGSGLNVDLSAEALRGMFQAVWQDLKAKRLWPVALVLLLGVVAVPVLLSKSASTPPPPPPVPTMPPAAPGLPAVTQRLLLPSQLKGTKRDPFTPQAGVAAASSTAPSSTGSAAGSTGSAVGTSAGGTGSTPSSAGSSPSPTSAGTTTTSTTTSTTTTGTTTTGGGNPSGTTGSGGKTPPPAGLTARQSYAVKLAISNSSGGINSLDPLQRLSVLPSLHQPLMVELGVLKGGSRVLFALAPGTVVSGPGQCVPGPIDCQIVSVTRNQVEHVGVQSKTGIARVDMFAVTGISTVTHGSVAAAQRARQNQSVAGQELLNHTHLSALSLFHYEPSAGVVVDMRNLTFGVNS